MRELASAGLDSGLTILDQRRVANHRRRCPECDGLIVAMAEVTHMVRRGAADATPSVVAAPPAVRRPARRRLLRPVAGLAFAVALAAAAGLGTLVASPGHAGRPAVQHRFLLAAHLNTTQLTELAQQEVRAGLLLRGLKLPRSSRLVA